MKVTFLGTGTSVGVPSVGCECETCLSKDPRDQRLRASVMVEDGGHTVIIDASIDFRQQALRVGLKRVDAILFTHAHADHCFGLDDARPLMFRNGAIPVYASDETWKGLRRVYAYAFDSSSPGGDVPRGVPRILPHVLDGDFDLFGLPVQPLTVIHGELPVTAFRIGGFAYITDCNLIPEETLMALTDLDALVIDALRIKRHPTHLALDQALEYIGRLGPRRAWLTHISHDIRHEATSKKLPPGVEIAFDGLTLVV
jgi:phosphoribosyl 1,2-cyclic phosphate phosphodiesterase